MSVKCTFGGRILGSDPNLTLWVLIILLTKLHACTLKWCEKTHTDFTIHRKIKDEFDQIKDKFDSFVL